MATVPDYIIALKTQVTAIEKVNKPLRGSDWLKELINREAYWIFTLDTIFPIVLNCKTELLFIY